MAKKSSSSTAPPAAPRRRATRSADQPAAAPIDIASVTPTERIDTAAEMRSHAANTASQPDYHEIARAAYQRYLSRGGSDGRDFDDWIEAERELAHRNSR